MEPQEYIKKYDIENKILKEKKNKRRRCPLCQKEMYTTNWKRHCNTQAHVVRIWTNQYLEIIHDILEEQNDENCDEELGDGLHILKQAVSRYNMLRNPNIPTNMKLNFYHNYLLQ